MESSNYIIRVVVDYDNHKTVYYHLKDLLESFVIKEARRRILRTKKGFLICLTEDECFLIMEDLKNLLKDKELKHTIKPVLNQNKDNV